MFFTSIKISLKTNIRGKEIFIFALICPATLLYISFVSATLSLSGSLFPFLSNSDIQEKKNTIEMWYVCVCESALHLNVAKQLKKFKIYIFAYFR